MSFNIEPDRIVYVGISFLIYDVSDMLPRHKNFPHGTSVTKPNRKPAIPPHWRFRRVPNRLVHTLYCHQTAGAVTYDGFDALINTYEFMCRDPGYTDDGKWTGRGRGWPSGCYTYYIPFNPVMHLGKALIFKCWDHDWVTWHSSDNDHSIAIVCQGYFRHRSMRTFRPRKGCESGRPSVPQVHALKDFINEYAIGEMCIPRENVKGHCDSPRPKAACPGDAIEEIYRPIQEGLGHGDLLKLPSHDPVLVPPMVGLLKLETWKERQAALVLLGHDIGSTGDKENGVDGDPGYLTRCAVETEEANLGLKVDGYWDDVIDYHIKVQLHARRKTQEDIDALV